MIERRAITKTSRWLRTGMFIRKNIFVPTYDALGNIDWSIKDVVGCYVFDRIIPSYNTQTQFQRELDHAVSKELSTLQYSLHDNNS